MPPSEEECSMISILASTAFVGSLRTSQKLRPYSIALFWARTGSRCDATRMIREAVGRH